MQTSDIIASLALLVSIVSAGFSWWSAREAAHTRKITRSQELAPHFINVGYLWDLIMKQGGKKEDIAAGKLSLKFLESHLSHDDELIGCLKNIPAWSEDIGIYGSFFTAPGTPYEIPENAPSAKEIFGRKQREYLSIG